MKNTPILTLAFIFLLPPILTAQDIATSSLLNGTYDPSIPTTEEVLGITTGERPVRYDEMVRYIRAVAEAAPQAELHTYGSTYEDRDLYYLVISSEQNLANLKQIRSDISRLADPWKLQSGDQAEQISRESPGIAWLLYSIHGDELSSTDAALGAHHVCHPGIPWEGAGDSVRRRTVFPGVYPRHREITDQCAAVRTGLRHSDGDTLEVGENSEYIQFLLANPLFN